MLDDRIEHKWIRAFERVFTLCAVQPGDAVAIVSETQSRGLNVQLAELALLQLGAKPFHIVLMTPEQTVPVAVRSTGASNAIQGSAPVIRALSDGVFIVDVTVEGLLHAPELPAILKTGSRILMISNEHPEALERLVPEAAFATKVKAGIKMLAKAKELRTRSAAGTDLTVNVDGAIAGGVWGWCDKPGQVAHWPGGLCLCFPRANSVNGRLVLDEGDVNLTFKRYLERPVTLTIESDYVTRIEGKGVDADLMRSYFEAWGDRNAYAVSHVGWGMNPGARWDSMVMYDKGDFNGTELRAFAGNFLYSTGANEVAKRHTLGHFDLPLRNCTVTLDGQQIVVDGRLQGELA